MSSILDNTSREIRSTDTPGEAAPLALLDRQRRALEMVVRGEPLPQVLEEICHIIEAVAPDRVAAAISLVEEGRLVHGAAPSLSDAYNALIDGIPVDPELGTCPVAAATRHTVITEDIASEPRWAPFAAHPLADGWQAGSVVDAHP